MMDLPLFDCLYVFKSSVLAFSDHGGGGGGVGGGGFEVSLKRGSAIKCQIQKI